MDENEEKGGPYPVKGGSYPVVDLEVRGRRVALGLVTTGLFLLSLVVFVVAWLFVPEKGARILLGTGALFAGAFAFAAGLHLLLWRR